LRRGPRSTWICAGDSLGDQRGIRTLADKRRGQAASDIDVLERRHAAGVRADDLHVADSGTAGRSQSFDHGVEIEQAGQQHRRGAERRGDDRRGTVGRRQHELVASAPRGLERRVALVKAGWHEALPLTRQDASGAAQARGPRDALGAQHSAISRSQRLRNGRGGPQHVDHHRDVGRAQLGAGHGDIDHAASGCSSASL
jgi:hypothetical protein